MDRPTNKPNIHVTAPQGWLNDPCAPSYDAATGTYHLFFQWNPYGCQWGNMSWGHVTSRDQLLWKRGPRQPALDRDKPYDKEGVFTGCMLPPSMIKDNNHLMICYSSVSHLPFQWNLPYPRNAAGISLARSSDGGGSWIKDTRNPILQGEPQHIDVTGFRDPFVDTWPEMNALLGQEAFYGVVAGGTKRDGPTAFLYRIDSGNFASWTYLGPLVTIPKSFRPSHTWSGCHGMNWECVNFLELQTDEKTQSILLVGAEGDTNRNHQQGYELPSSVSPRGKSWQLWLAGDLVRVGRTAQFQERYGGILDHGVFYAASSFTDPTTAKRVVHGWVKEEDISTDRVNSKGWTSCLAIPREIFLKQIPRVEKAMVSELADISSMEITATLEGTVMLRTLGIRPLSETAKYRVGSTHHQFVSVSLPSGKDLSQYLSLPLVQLPHKTWELRSTIHVLPGCRKVGFHILSSNQSFRAPTNLCTTVEFNPFEESIVVDRSNSTAYTDVNLCLEKGPHTLFTAIDEKGARQQEPLLLTIFVDANVIEIFANDRFALTTMVYPSTNPAEALWIGAFVDGDIDPTTFAVFEEISIWSGLNGDRSIVDE